MTETSSYRFGVVLMNVGTPQAPTPAAVRRYLGEFLMDGRVIDLPLVQRWLLVHGIILRTRPRKSAAAYAAIWTPEGSPLLVESQRLVERVAAELGEEASVRLGMRYGSPSIRAAVRELVDLGVRQIVGVPLFPQASEAARGTAVAELRAALKGEPGVELRLTDTFYDAPGFIAAFTEVARSHLQRARADHVLMSYHGLPERHVRREDVSGAHCLARPDCCSAIVDANKTCYRAHCFATSRALAASLALPEGGWSVSFQSRLGRDRWIAPYTDVVLEELRRAGKTRLAVLCPAFVTDCLETLEEIGLRAREQWRELGGDELTLVPSLNATPLWAREVARMVRAARL